MQQQTGILELFGRPDGRLRLLDKTLISSPSDPVVPANIIQRFGLRPGLVVEVETTRSGNGHPHKQQHHQHHRHGKKGKQKNKQPAIAPNAPRVQNVLKIEGLVPDEFAKRRKFEELTSIDPQPRLTLEYPGCPPACRFIDLFCPIGFGQRGMIVSPPKAGKTTLLHNIANSVARNHPQVEVYALLVDERPEEVTDFRRNVPCTVLASSNDHTADKHAALAMLTIDRAKRMAESGRDVLILLDSLTRLGRAFNVAPQVQSLGRTLSGGLDASALAIPKQLFGAARKFEEGGSLTIIATALVDTGSRGDQVIFEEFKGTGNMELILDRQIADRRIFPAMNLAASGTRKEHLLVGETELTGANALRRRLLNMPPAMQVESLLKVLERYKTNRELTDFLNQHPTM